MENANKPEKIEKKGFFEDKYNIVFVAVLVFAAIIRIYYFILTKGQPFWFDETEYLGMAKHWAFGTYAHMNAQRVPIMPFLAAIIYKLGGAATAVKFFTSVLPSIGIVAMFYFIGSKMYDKKAGLLASAMAAVFWVLLFWTNRANTDMLAFFFALAAIYFMWTGFVLKENEKHIRYALPLFILSFLTKPNMAIVILTAAVFLLFYCRTGLFRKKQLWESFALTLPIVIPFFIWQKLQYGTFLAFRGASHVAAKGTALQVSNKPIAWYVFSFVQSFTEKVFFWPAMLGLALFVAYLFLGKDLIRKDSRLAANLFLISLFAISLVYFVFIERDAEDRWILPMSLSLFFAVAVCLGHTQKFLEKSNKHFALAVIVLIFASGAYFQLAHADFITKAKINTYTQEPAAGAWLKEHTSPEDLIISNNEHVPLIYYSERKVDGVSIFETKDKLKELKPRYYVVTAYFPSAQWTYELPQKNPGSFVLAQGFFETRNGQQAPVIGIYEFRNYDF